jgi:two-component system response regulator YesN
MESLQDRSIGFEKRIFVSGDLRQIDSQKVMTTIKHLKAVQKALDLIKTRIQDPPTLGELASFAGLSRTYFSSVFKDVVGTGFQNYLIQVRINKAKDLLGDINLTVKQVAYAVGFRDPDYFCRTFKQKMGVSPTNWRLREMKNLRSQES